MRDKDVPTSQICRYLREQAKVEAKEQGFNHEEHTMWIAANRLEDMCDMLEGKDAPDLLRLLADRIQYGDLAIERKVW